jgi:hypothetical protein
MGQIKGNPSTTRSVQNQAYSNLYTNNTSQTGADRRDMGVKPVLIDDQTTLNEVVDITFETDAMAALVSQSVDVRIESEVSTLNTTITNVSSSINTTLGAVSSSINTTLGAVSSSINTTLGAVSSSINTTLGAVSSSINTTLGAVSSSISSSINLTISVPGTYANDAAAQAAGVRIGGLYHTSGTVKVRLV